MNATPVFVVGCARSGTTLLRLMLDAHPELAIPPESHFLPKLARRFGTGTVDAGAVAREIIGTKTFEAWDLPPDDVLDRASGPTFADAIDSIYRAYAEPRGKSRWGDKTPAYVLQIPLLAGIFPGSRFLHIVRDGRDVASSLKTVRFGPKDPMGAAIFWERRVRAGMRDGRALGRARYRQIRYERLVNDAEPELRVTCAFLDLPFDSVMLSAHERLADALREDRRVQHRHEGRPATPGLRDWRADMTHRDVAAFEAVAGELLEELGYPRGAPEPGPTLRVKAALWRARSRRSARRPDDAPY